MPQLNLKPAHKSVQDYYKVLGEYGQLNIDHEMAVRSAFQGLLRTCARQFDWTLVPEYPVRRTKQVPLKVDGALLDTFRLTHGFWEAKDERDELEREVERKLTLGYPDKNIIFQSPRNAILIQSGRLAWKNTITDPEALVEVLHQFFDYSDPEIMGWEDAASRFKNEVPEQSRALKELIDEQRKKNRPFVEALTAFVETCRQALNPNLSEDAVERMLIQHLLTERIFSKVFDNEDFRTRNVVAIEIEKVISALIKGSFNRSDFLRRLDPFYKAIELSAANTSGYTEKQEFLNTVYERFFQGFSPKEADTHGIVYTPQPIVDFMVRSVEDILEKEFGKSLADRGVHILDPFVGTGNFITRVMKEIAAKKKSALPYKYREELHCNEVMLLPYYIASMNIEHEYLDAMGEYEPFPGICLVDTFELAEPKQSTLGFMNEENTARVQRQKQSPITVIIGNPPYNSAQVSENDNNKNRKYPALDSRVSDTYGRASNATLLNKLNDPYVKAIRWASDRLQADGIVALITNSSFVEQIAFDGMRTHLVRDFDAIYILDLGGNVRKNPKLSGTTHNVFGIQVGVSISFFVRRTSDRKLPALIDYARVGESWRKEQKYDFLDERGDRNGIEWQRLQPDSKANWLTADLEEEFDTFMPSALKRAKSQDASQLPCLFSFVSNGVLTARDEWVYAFDAEQLRQKVEQLIDNYNSELGRLGTAKKIKVEEVINTETAFMKWTDRLKDALEKGRRLDYEPKKIRRAMFRPFAKKFLYFDHLLNQRRYHEELVFPNVATESENMSIWLKVAGEWPTFALATAVIPDYLPSGGSQCFPFYTYDEDGTNRRENITDWVLEQFRSHYADRSITKWDIFHYVYAVLHHPVYRERYAANLKRELPRIPFVGSSASSAPSAVNDVFRAFVAAGQRLADLHVNYEQQPEYSSLTWLENPQARLNYRVEKMRLDKDKSSLFYNEYWTLTNIPADVYEYRLGNRSALEWILDQYQVLTDKRSGITNDPNREDVPEYIKRLIGQVIYVSLETLKIVKALPEFLVSEQQNAVGA